MLSRPTWRRCAGGSLAAASLALAAFAIPAAPASAAGCPPPSGGSYAKAVLADAPLAYYRLGESSGPTLCSSALPAAVGTFAAGVVLGLPGALGGDPDTAVAVRLRSAGIGTAGPGVSGNHSFTLEGWFRSAGTTQNQVLVGMGVPGLGRIAGLAIWSNYTPGTGSAGRSELGLDTYSSANHWATSAAGVDLWDGRWHQLAVTYNQAADRVTGYVDGRGLAEQKPTSLNLGVSNIRLGYWIDSVVNRPLVGDADEIAVYPSALPAGRVAAHYRAAIRCVVPSLSGKSLKAARKLLAGGHCALGKVTKPKPARGVKLVVRRSSPSAGTVLPRGARVRVTLMKR